MRFRPTFIVFLFLAGFIGCAQETEAPNQPASDAPEPMPQEMTFETYLVARAPTDAEGEQIGCEDVLVASSQTATQDGHPLRVALNALFATAATDSLDNAVEGLSVGDVTVEDGTATVQLAGDLNLGGVCDHPRVEAQLKRTALQFADVDSVAFFINGEPL